jgi:hypothetical protein
MAPGSGDTRRVSNQRREVRRGRDYWVGVVGEFAGSGLTQREFCERRGVKFTAFRNWLYRLRGTSNRQSSRKRRAGGFVQVVPAPKPKPNVMCKLQFGRTELFFSELPPTEYLGALLRLMDR